jgi:hypothetical protein
MKYLINKKINIFILALFISIIPNITKAAFIGASAPVTATTSCNTGLSCGLVGYWTFDGKNIVNGVVKDMSGSGNDGNTVNIASSTFYAPGKIGQAGSTAASSIPLRAMHRSLPIKSSTSRRVFRFYDYYRAS